MTKTSKILIFGRNGQVGSNLEDILLSGQGELENRQIHYKCIAVGRSQIDLTRIDDITNFIIQHSPQWVINASAYTAVDRAESEPDLAHKINCLAPAAMAKACKDSQSNFLHYSTDYVFDGSATQPYSEADKINPQSEYGKSKAAGEKQILDQNDQSIILRTAWVYARKGNNFVNTMLKLAKERESISVVSDQYGSPTFASDLAQATINIIKDIEKGKIQFQPGIFHATGQGVTNWFEFCSEIFRIIDNRKIKVIPISSDQYPTPAPRPSFSVLDNTKLKQSYCQSLPEWRSSLYRCLQT